MTLFIIGIKLNNTIKRQPNDFKLLNKTYSTCLKTI